MRVGSLFSGVGGFDLGLERAGHEIAWHSEIEPHACAVLRERWPDVPNLGDVTKIDGAAIPPVDVICGGFPCQDLSVAGKRRGFDGERSVLAFEFLRIVREMREATDGRAPAFIVLENVPGLFSASRGRDFAALLDALGELGPMDVAWRVLDSRFFGVAQRRRRVFVVVDFGGERCDEVLALTEGLRWNPPAGRAAREDVAGTLGGGSSERCWADDTDRTTFVCGAVSSKWAKGTGGPAGDECYNLVANTLRADGFDASEDGTGRGTPLVSVAFNWQSGGDCRGLNPQGTTNALHRGQVPAVIPFQEVGRPTDGQREPTSAFSGVRRLTPLETERLQAFPDDWARYGRKPDGTRYELADGPRYKCMGNAVTVSVAEWLGKRMAAAVRAARLRQEEGR